MVALAVGALDLWIRFKLFNREEHGKVSLAVLADILVSRHGDILLKGAEK